MIKNPCKVYIWMMTVLFYKLGIIKGFTYLTTQQIMIPKGESVAIDLEFSEGSESLKIPKIIKISPVL